MDGWWLHHLFCLQAGNGFDWPSRQHSGSVALSVCISSRKLSCWKRLIIGLKSGVMIVYRTRFPSGCLSFILPFFFFVSLDPFCFPYFLSSPSPVTQLLMKFTFAIAGSATVPAPRCIHGVCLVSCAAAQVSVPASCWEQPASHSFALVLLIVALYSHINRIQCRWWNEKVPCNSSR